MAYISGLLLIDCPASALNNAGKFLPMDTGPSNYENWVSVKKIHTKQGTFPYVSAQAFRAWLRQSLTSVAGWTPSPVFREAKVAYTDANPIAYSEDDLFGYMRAPASIKESESDDHDKRWKEKGLIGQDSAKDKKAKGNLNFGALTRSSPFRVSTLISIGPVELGHDYGNMARHEGDPVLVEHEFYRTTLVGLFSLDLRMVGRFYYADRTGYRHLDDVRKKLAEERNLAQYGGEQAYELSLPDRTARVEQLLEGVARLAGGAKLALHYTDVSPRLVMLGVSSGGNHLFGTAVGASAKGEPVLKLQALEQIAKVFEADLLSTFYVGLTQGYLDDQRSQLEATLKGLTMKPLPCDGTLAVGHPVEAIRFLIKDLKTNAAEWLA